MKREFIIIALLIFIVIIKIIVGATEPTNQTSLEDETKGVNGSSIVEETTSEVDNVVDETNADQLSIDIEDINSLIVDEETGESCNGYIPDLIDNGIASYVISSDNDVFNYFCSQTIGGSSYDDLDMSGYSSPPIIETYFSDATTNQTVIYVSTMYTSEDVYTTCFLNVEPSSYIEYKAFSLLNCELTTVDSHEYFTPQKQYRDVPGQEYPEPYMTDTKVLGNMYSEYAADFDQIGRWYGENTSMTIDDFVNTLPPENELSLNVVDYNELMKLLTELQNNVSTNFIDPTK